MKCIGILYSVVLFTAVTLTQNVDAYPLQHQVVIDRSDTPTYYKEVTYNYTVTHEHSTHHHNVEEADKKNGTVAAIGRFVKHPLAPWATAVTSLGLNGLQAYYNHKNYKLKVEAEKALKGMSYGGLPLRDKSNDDADDVDGGVRLPNRNRRSPKESRSVSPKSPEANLPHRKASKERMASVVDEAIANAVEKYRRTSEEKSPLFKRRSSDAIKAFEERHQKLQRKGPESSGYQHVYDDEGHKKAWSPLNLE